MAKTFSITNIWNEKLSVFHAEAKKRNYISASDIGKPFLDRYWKMKGVKPTNTPDARILRVFDAGNLFEWLVIKVFTMTGLLQGSQVQVRIPKTKNHMAVLGYIDLILGGNPDWNKSRARILEEDLPDWVKIRSQKLIDNLEEKYPDGLEPIVVEVKSVNSRAFWGKKNINKETGLFKGYKHHQFQLYTYLLGQDIKKGRLFYISRDDLTVVENGININPKMTEAWLKDVKTMSHYYQNNIEPEQPPDLIFEEGKWRSNWMKGWSPYLTKMTGLTKSKWENRWYYQATKKNKELEKNKTKEKQKK